MHFKYIIGFLLIFLVTKSHSKATEPPIFYEDEDSPNSVEDYYYYNDEENDTQILSTNHNDTTIITTITSPITITTLNFETTTASIVMTTTMNKIPDLSLKLPKLEPKCPEDCDCKNDYQYINCSYKNFKNIPNDIPETVLILDLSYNLIDKLENNSFDNYQNIQELIMTGNHIKNISEETFSKLDNLKKVRLDDNLLTSIHPNTFINSKQLEMLNLSNNAIKLSENIPFLNQNHLEELYLSNNNLTEIYNETFINLNGLKLLNMDSNEFAQKINIKAFEPLKDLTQLKLPNLQEDTIRELCEILMSIDVISFDKFDVSCFQLSSGQNFSESIFNFNPNMMDQQNGIEENTTTNKELKTTSALVILGTTIKPSEGSSLTSTLVNDSSTRFNESLSHTNNKILDNNEDNEKTYQVAISSQTINHILIAIIIIAVIGLLIGVICRKDVCGIKTKLCRTKRPPSTDQIRPAEEVPLNKIV